MKRRTLEGIEWSSWPSTLSVMTEYPCVVRRIMLFGALEKLVVSRLDVNHENLIGGMGFQVPAEVFSPMGVIALGEGIKLEPFCPIEVKLDGSGTAKLKVVVEVIESREANDFRGK